MIAGKKDAQPRSRGGGSPRDLSAGACACAAVAGLGTMQPRGGERSFARCTDQRLHRIDPVRKGDQVGPRLAFYKRGDAFYYRGDSDRAIADYSEAMKLGLYLADVLNNRAIA